MTWTTANNEAFGSDLVAFAQRMQKIYEEGVRLQRKYVANGVAASPEFTDSAALLKEDAQAMMVLIDQFSKFLENKNVATGDYGTTLWKTLRTTSF